MFDYLRENPGIKLLVNVILGIILFKFLFGLVYGGSSYGTVQSLIALIFQLAKIVLVLGLAAASMVVTNKLLSGKDLTKLEFNPEQIFKGVVLVILGFAAFYLLSGILGGNNSSYYNMGGNHPGFFGTTNSFDINGLFGGVLSLIINLLSIALVVFLVLGAFQAGKPYLEKEFGSLWSDFKKPNNESEVHQPVTQESVAQESVTPIEDQVVENAAPKKGRRQKASAQQ